MFTKGDKVYLDGKTSFILLAFNDRIAVISNGDEKLTVQIGRLTKENKEL